MTTQGATVGVLSAAGILTASPFGLSIETIALGTAFCIVGVTGRAAFELQRTAEGPGGLKLSKIAGWVGAGLIGSPFVTILYLVLLKLAGIQSDGLIVLGLLFFGFSGPKVTSWLLNTSAGILSKRFGVNVPNPIAPPTDPKT